MLFMFKMNLKARNRCCTHRMRNSKYQTRIQAIRHGESHDYNGCLHSCNLMLFLIRLVKLTVCFRILPRWTPRLLVTHQRLVRFTSHIMIYFELLDSLNINDHVFLCPEKCQKSLRIMASSRCPIISLHGTYNKILDRVTTYHCIGNNFFLLLILIWWRSFDRNTNNFEISGLVKF